MLVYNRDKRLDLIIISGTSGSGKTWVSSRLSNKRFLPVKTYTTREQRSPDEYYNFISEAEMDAKWDSFIQHFKSGNTRYGCGLSDLMEISSTGRVPILVAAPSAMMEIFHSLQVEENNGGLKFSILYIHIACEPEEALFNITKLRGSPTDEVIQRVYDMDVVINSAFEEFLEDVSYDFIKEGVNSFEVVDSSLAALEVIIKQFSTE